MIRRDVRSLALLPLVACGVFGGGTEESPAPVAEPTRTPEQEKQKAEDNAKPIDATGVAPLEGVFVSSAALDDAGDGSREKPFKSINKGLAKGKELGKRVLVCAVKGAPYTEQITLVDGVSVFGDVVCADGKWAVDKTARAEIVSPESPALVAEGLKLKVRVEGFDVTAPDLGIEAPTPNSVALRGRDVADLTFALGSLRAGNARPGKSAGAAPEQQNVGDISGGKGANRRACGIGDVCDPGLGGKYGQTQDGAKGGVGACKFGDAGRAGGKGGYGGFWVAGYSNPDLFQAPVGTANLSDTGEATDVPGGALAAFSGPASSAAGKTGIDGIAGADGSNADASVSAPGRFVRDGFVPADGASGKAGGSGGGGSGGAGSTSMMIPGTGTSCVITSAVNGKHFYAAGGGGGAGGCGGQPNEAGAGGGASIAALLVSAVVNFETTRLRTGAGGAAGRGGFGSPPTAGGAGGLGGDNTNTCANAGRGGSGGFGGVPGFSGHGAGGPSIGVAYAGKAPTQVDTTITLGTPGNAQDEASFTFPNGTVQRIPKGAAGEARELFSFSVE